MLRVGEETTTVKEINWRTIRGFCDSVRDFNMIHSDLEAAAKLDFPGIPAPGMLPLSLVSTALFWLAGEGVVIEELKGGVKFKEPVFFGDEISVKVKVEKKQPNSGAHERYEVSAVFLNQFREEVISPNRAVIFVPNFIV